MNLSRILFLYLISIYSSFVLGNSLWSGEKWLNQDYLLKWRTNDIKKCILIRVEVKTKGWIGFGFSSHGKTTEADMAYGWVDSRGTPVLNDFWVTENGTRLLDQSQDWHLHHSSENSTHTVLELERKYRTCDTENDLEIYVNEYEMSNIVFAYSLLDPKSVETIDVPHVESVLHLSLFLDETILEPKENDIIELVHWMNLTIPAKEKSTKWCQFVKNESPYRHMITKMQTEIIPAESATNHHFMMCRYKKHLDTSLLEKYARQTMPCYDLPKEALFLRMNCLDSFYYSSMLSSDPVYFPDITGITIDPDETPYFIMEAHIINEFDYPVNITVATRTWITRQFRQYEMGRHIFGAAVGFVYDNWGYIIPPKVPSFKVTAVLDSYCLELDENGINIFSLVFHSHHVKHMEVRHYRNDHIYRSLRYNHYDSMYQPYRPVRPPLNFRNEDKIVLICEVNSMGHDQSYTTPAEHCIINFYYYPKVKTMTVASLAWSRITYKTMLTITGLDRIDGYNQTIDKIIVREPAQFNNTKLMDFVADNKYKINDPVDLEKLQISSDRDECCSVLEILPCKTVKPPPDLFRDVSNYRAQNSCSNTTANQEKNIKVPRSQSEANNQRVEGLKGMKFSLKFLLNYFKILLNFELE